MKGIMIVFILFLSVITLYSQDTNTSETPSIQEPSIEENATEGKTNETSSSISSANGQNQAQLTTNKEEPARQPVKKAEEQPVKTDEIRLLAAIDANPKKADSYNRLIQYYYIQGKHKERLKTALRAIQSMGRTAYWCEIVGDENKFLGDFQNALISYQFALMLIPADSDIYNRIGLTLLKMSYFNQAETAFKAALFFSPNDDFADKSIYLNNLALSLESMHDLQSAYRYLQIAVKYNPAFNAAQENAARIKNIMISSGIPIN